MGISKTVRKTGKTVVQVFDTAGDIAELTFYVMKQLAKSFPSLGKLLLILMKTNAKIVRDLSELTPYVGNVSLILPGIVVFTFLNYLINLINKNEKGNEFIDNLFMMRKVSIVKKS